VLHGIGSPHTDPGYVWPIALSLQGLTTDSKEEIEEILEMQELDAAVKADGVWEDDKTV
jgi:meiotically up-regulated gene 157 (Mug157) protein